MIFSWLTPNVRRAIYVLAAAIVALVRTIGWLDEHLGARILEAVAAILALMVALAHVPNQDVPQAPVADAPTPVTPDISGDCP